jgi:hypothetical protein
MAPNYSRIVAQGPGTLHTIYYESRFWARGQLLARAQKALRPMEETNVGPLNLASFRRVRGGLRFGHSVVTLELQVPSGRAFFLHSI